MKNEWFYQLLGRNLEASSVLAVADVLTSIGSTSIIYRGVVSEFDIAESGGLKLLALDDAKRGKGRGDEFKWIDVPGSRLILLGGCIHSINITHVALEPVRTSFGRKFWNEDQ